MKNSPTQKQIKAVKIICETFNISGPKEETYDEYHKFLNIYMPMLKTRNVDKNKALYRSYLKSQQTMYDIKNKNKWRNIKN